MTTKEMIITHACLRISNHVNFDKTKMDEMDQLERAYIIQTEKVLTDDSEYQRIFNDLVNYFGL